MGELFILFFLVGGLQVDLHMKEEVCVCSALLEE